LSIQKGKKARAPKAAKLAKPAQEVQVNFIPPGKAVVPESGAWISLQNSVMDELLERTMRKTTEDQKLILDFLEIADFMLKNTTGTGSHIHLADCDLNGLGLQEIRKYFTLVLALLGFHAGQLLPEKARTLWELVKQVTNDPETCEALARELETCRDQDGEFSPIRAGRKLWEHAASLLKIHDAESNAPGRFYYQTAPAQDLVFILENMSLR
jgi:hypothetical protein